MTEHRGNQDRAPEANDARVQEPGCRRVDDGVDVPVAPVETTAGEAETPSYWRPVAGYLLGWMVGTAGLVGLVAVVGSQVDWSLSRWVACLLPASLFFGFIAVAIAIAFTWSSGRWNRLGPRKLLLRLVVRVIVCAAAIVIPFGLAILEGLRHVWRNM
jgi:hypothetical protein